MAGKSADVHFVDDGLDKRTPERNISLPVIDPGICHHALHRGRAIIAWPGRGDAAVSVRHRHGLAIGIEKDLVVIKSQSSLRLEWTVCAVPVDLSRLKTGDENMPVVIRSVLPGIEGDNVGRLRIIHMIE